MHEASLVSVPADPLSGIRSLLRTGLDRAAFVGVSDDVRDIRQRMLSRQRMATRARMVAAQVVIGRDNE